MQNNLLNSENINFDGVDYKLIWSDQMPDLKKGKITQVSGFVLNDKNQVLVIKNKHGWGIPGGHPETSDKTLMDVLIREVFEESCVEIKNKIEYIGCVIVENIINQEINYQMRYIGYLANIKSFEQKYETSGRDFVKINNLGNYVDWIKGYIGNIQKQKLLQFTTINYD